MNKKLSRKTIYRVLNFIAAIGIGFVGVYRLTSYHIAKISDAVLSVYFFVFAILLALTELRLKFVKREFSFLSNPLGKGMFLIFCGIIFLDKTVDVVVIIGIALIVLGLFNIISYKWLKSNKSQKAQAQDRQQDYQVTGTNDNKDAEKTKSSKSKKQTEAQKLESIRGELGSIKIKNDLESGQTRNMMVI